MSETMKESKQDPQQQVQDDQNSFQRKYNRQATISAMEVKEKQKAEQLQQIVEQKLQQKEVHDLSVRYMKLEYSAKDYQVIKEGDIGDKFYVLLQGKCGVYKNQYVEEVQTLQTSYGKTKNVTIQKIVGETFLGYELIAGQAFGELALLNSKPRAATIKCHTDCQFATLSKPEFDQVLIQFQNEGSSQQLEELQRNPVFESWTLSQIKDLYINTYRINYKQYEQVFKENDECDSVYLILKGEFTITQVQQTNAVESQMQEKKNLDSFKKKKTSIQKQMKIMTMAEGYFFGEEDIINDRNRSFGVYCSTQEGILLMIKKSVFKMRICQDQNTYNFLLQRLQNKEKFRQERIIQVNQTLNKYQNMFQEEVELPQNNENLIEQTQIKYNQIFPDITSTYKPNITSNLNNNTIDNNYTVSQFNNNSEFQQENVKSQNKHFPLLQKQQNIIGSQSSKTFYQVKNNNQLKQYDALDFQKHFLLKKEKNLGQQQINSQKIINNVSQVNFASIINIKVQKINQGRGPNSQQCQQGLLMDIDEMLEALNENNEEINKSQAMLKQQQQMTVAEFYLQKNFKKSAWFYNKNKDLEQIKIRFNQFQNELNNSQNQQIEDEKNKLLQKEGDSNFLNSKREDQFYSKSEKKIVNLQNLNLATQETNYSDQNNNNNNFITQYHDSLQFQTYNSFEKKSLKTTEMSQNQLKTTEQSQNQLLDQQILYGSASVEQYKNISDQDQLDLQKEENLNKTTFRVKDKIQDNNLKTEKKSLMLQKLRHDTQNIKNSQRSQNTVKMRSSTYFTQIDYNNSCHGDHKNKDEINDNFQSLLTKDLKVLIQKVQNLKKPFNKKYQRSVSSMKLKSVENQAFINNEQFHLKSYGNINNYNNFQQNQFNNLILTQKLKLKK